MKYFAFFFILFYNIGVAQPQFYYKTSDDQSFRIRPGTHHLFHYVQLDRGQIATNTLFEIDNATKELIIPQNGLDRKSTRLNSSHVRISYAVFCLRKKNNT